MKKLLRGVFPVLLVTMLVSSSALAQLGARVANWRAPQRAISSAGARAMGIESDIGEGGTVLIPVTPCRIVDTRGPAGPYGAPSLVAGSPRNFALLGGPCTGLPPAVIAYSLNITATNTTGPGFFKVFPQGSAPPVVSTLNYTAGQTVANAAIVPAGTGSGITVSAGVSAADLIIDINGYFVGNGSLAPLNPGEYVGWQGNVPSGGVLFGWNTNASGTGVYGFGPGYGVYGSSVATSFSITLAGVWGTSTNAIGTFGHSVNSNGMWAESTSYDALAAFGGRDGTYSQGARHGVIGISTATSGAGTSGVIGQTYNTIGGSAGVQGYDVSGYNPTPGFFKPAGVTGNSLSNYGVLGRSRYAGVYGSLLDSTDNVIDFGLLGTTYGTAFDAATGPWGVFAGGNFGATGTKHFVEPHPSDPRKVILYSSIEGRTVDTYFRGTAHTVDGRAVVEVPEDFRIVTSEEGLTVQLTPVGPLAMMSVESQDLHQIVVRSSRDVTFHYRVEGLRRAFKDLQPVQTGNEFMPASADATIPRYLTEEARKRLIANGTYNADGTVNMGTAQRLGWTRAWEMQAEEARAQAESAQERAASRSPQ